MDQEYNKEYWENYYKNENKKLEVEKLLKTLESEYFKIDKKQFTKLIRKNIHPYHMEKIAIAFLTAIADFDKYFPLLLNEIADQFKDPFLWSEKK